MCGYSAAFACASFDDPTYVRILVFLIMDVVTRGCEATPSYTLITNVGNDYVMKTLAFAMAQGPSPQSAYVRTYILDTIDGSQPRCVRTHIAPAMASDNLGDGFNTEAIALATERSLQDMMIKYIEFIVQMAIEQIVLPFSTHGNEWISMNLAPLMARSQDVRDAVLVLVWIFCPC